MRLSKLCSNIRGDTIVEVLIALVVTSTVIGGAYVSSNRSLQNTRQAQERGQALKQVAGQVERLKVLISNPVYRAQLIDSPTAPNVFCINSGNVKVQAKPVAVLPSADSDDFIYPPGCKVTGNITYHLAAERTGSSNYVFKFHARWDRLGGGRDEVVINYRFDE